MKVDKCKIIENKMISENICELVIKWDNSENNNDIIIPGQFFMLKTLDNSFFLPRPISVNNVGKDTVTFLYRLQGTGTKTISKLGKNQEIQITGPLGNGFDINLLKGKIAVVGGGIGIAPLLYLVKKLGKNADVFLGFRDDVYLTEDFEMYSNNTVIVTEDGNIGEKGYVTDYINYGNYDVVVACGPEIMMKKIVDKCKENEITCYISLERRMACGLGACLGCTVETIHGNKRACKDGPVFLSNDIIFKREA